MRRYLFLMLALAIVLLSSFAAPSNFIDLSKSGTANCYIVSKSGYYKFSAVKGNSNESVGSVSSVAVLWESYGTDVKPSVGALIKKVAFNKGYIAFQTADTFKEGNAVIAAKDVDGNILWSWHIWFTDQPKEHVYYNNAGTMMDRNLGATSATPGDVGALGLLYQWGRKDPFLGSSSISSSTLAKSTIAWPFAVSSDSSTGTIAYATANPTTFIKYNNENGDWYYTGSSSTDNTRWTTSENRKSIYDPCPAGWRVPDGASKGVWSKALGSLSYTGTYNSTNEGINFSGKFGSASTIWYPASGYRSYYESGLYEVGDYGYYWSASPGNNGAYSLCFGYSGYVSPSNDYNRADGFSVRCVKGDNDSNHYVFTSKPNEQTISVYSDRCVVGENKYGKFILLDNVASVYVNAGGNLYQLAKKAIEGVSTSEEWGTEIWENVTDITISGVMDARDFSTLKWNFRKLRNLDISDVVISAYTGDKGTVEGYTYSYNADELPLGSFFYWQSNYLRPFPRELYDEGMPSLQTVKLPATIKHIGRNALARAYNLKEIVIPEGVETIGNWAFSLCFSLERIYLPQSIRSLGSGSFTSTDNLKEIHVLNPLAPDHNESFGNHKGWYQSFVGKWGNITRKDLPQDTYFVESRATLYIPSGSSNNYRGWYKYFNRIVEE